MRKIFMEFTLKLGLFKHTSTFYSHFNPPAAYLTTAVSYVRKMCNNLTPVVLAAVGHHVRDGLQGGAEVGEVC